MNVTNKTALVTGGGRGIGRAISTALARAGASVAVGYRVDAEAAAQTVNTLGDEGLHALAVQVSVQDRDSIRAARDNVADAWGGIDVLVNNAAMAQEKPVETITDDDWDTMLAVNLRGPFACAQECLPHMVEQQWGRIINIASVGGQWGGFNQVHYAAAKAGLINLTKSLAKIYGDRGITSNAVSPGLVGTDMAADELESEAGKKKVANIPMGRIATADEIASVVVFLASDDADYVTGQTLNVNGGMYTL